MTRKGILICWFLLIIIIGLISCNEKGSEEIEPVPPLKFMHVKFDMSHLYFSTDGSMTNPVDSNQAKLIANKIDFTVVYPITLRGIPSLLDPITRSQHQSVDDYYQPWLSVGIETKFYHTNLSLNDFDSAKADEKKIDQYFETGNFTLISNESFPIGTLFGSIGPSSPVGYGLVIAFENIQLEKRGLITVYDAFASSTIPQSDYYFTLYLNIIREH